MICEKHGCWIVDEDLTMLTTISPLPPPLVLMNLFCAHSGLFQFQWAAVPVARNVPRQWNGG